MIIGAKAGFRADQDWYKCTEPGMPHMRTWRKRKVDLEAQEKLRPWQITTNLRPNLSRSASNHERGLPSCRVSDAAVPVSAAKMHRGTLKSDFNATTKARRPKTATRGESATSISSMTVYPVEHCPSGRKSEWLCLIL